MNSTCWLSGYKEMHQDFPFCKMETVTLLSKRGLSVSWGCSLAAEMRWHIVLTVPNIVSLETRRKMLSAKVPQALQLSVLVCSYRACNHWPSGHIWFTDGGRYFWWHLAAAFSQWWTLGSGRCFLPGPKCPSLYWSSEHSAKHIYFWSYCAVGPLREVRCGRKRGIWWSGQFNFVFVIYCGNVFNP